MRHLCAVNVFGVFRVRISAETSVILTVFLLRHVLWQNADAVPTSDFLSSDLPPVKVLYSLVTDSVVK